MNCVWNQPSFITARDESASGTLTPAATKVRPMTVSGTPSVKPREYVEMRLIWQLTRTYEKQLIRKLTHNSDHPNHEVGKYGDPNHCHGESDDIPRTPLFQSAVRHGVVEKVDEGEWHPPQTLFKCTSFRGIELGHDGHGDHRNFIWGVISWFSTRPIHPTWTEMQCLKIMFCPKNNSMLLLPLYYVFWNQMGHFHHAQSNFICQRKVSDFSTVPNPQLWSEHDSISSIYVRPNCLSAS